MKHVIFRLEAEEFAVSVERVLSIETVPEIRPVPTSENAVKGLSNLRGNVITVLDMNEIIHDRALQLTEDARMLVIGSFGYLVNSATDIVDVVEEEIEPFEGNEHVRGVWNAGNGRLVLVVDTDRLMSV